MSKPSAEQIELVERVEKTFEALRTLSNESLIFLALAELLEAHVDVPVGKRIPLAVELKRRARFRNGS